MKHKITSNIIDKETTEKILYALDRRNNALMELNKAFKNKV